MNQESLAKALRNQQGSALLMVMVIAVVGAMVAAVTMKATSRTVKTSGGIRVSSSLLNIAEAGKEHALSKLRTSTELPKANELSTIVNTTPFGGGSYTVTCQANGDATRLVLVSTATYAGKSRAIESSVRVTPCPSTDKVPFDIVNGTVKPTEEYYLTVTCLGAAFQLSYNNSWYSAPVAIQLKIGATTVDPWGSFSSVNSTINDGNNPRVYEHPLLLAGNTAVGISAKVWEKTGKKSYGLYKTVHSTPLTEYVKVLRNGDPVPQVNGFLNQSDISEYVKDYVVKGKIQLSENQAIFLFEFYSTSGAYADFQDAVFLVSMEKQAATSCACQCSDPGAVGGKININPSNSNQNEFVLTLSDGSTITRDDLHDGHPGYNGQALSVRVKPKGNGNQNSLTLDGEVYVLENKNRYEITAAWMKVNLYHEAQGNGNAMGKWWISIDASSATISNAGEADDCSCDCSTSSSECSGAIYEVVDWRELNM